MDTKPTPAESELIFPLDSKPPLGVAFIAALQHILSMILSVMAPPSIVGAALGLDVLTIAYLVSMSLLFAGIGIFFQARRPLGIGSGMLSIQATSFVFPGALIAVGTVLLKEQGMSTDQMLATLFGTCFIGGIIVMICSRFIRYLQKIITNTVSGVTVMMIGLSLIHVAADSFAGGQAARAVGEYGSVSNLCVGASVLLVILICNRIRVKFIRMSALVIGIVVGFIVSACLGMVDWSILSQTHHWFEYPVPFKFGFFEFNLQALLAIAFLFLVTVIEAIGDLTATSAVSEQPTEGKLFESRLTGGILCDGLMTSLGAMFGCFPVATFSQNNGVIQLSGVASRRVGIICGFIFIAFALFPFIVVLFQLIPAPVLGGALLVLFGSITCSGIRILAHNKIDRRESLIIAASLGVGVMTMVSADAFAMLPSVLRMFFDSSIVAGGVSAMIFNLVLPKNI